MVVRKAAGSWRLYDCRYACSGDRRDFAALDGHQEGLPGAMPLRAQAGAARKMSDRYVHLYPFTGRWDHRQDNLITLAGYLVVNSGSIRAAGGLAFGYEDMTGFSPLPAAIEMVAQGPRPPFAYGPQAGLRGEPGEDWPAYVQRVFGVHDHRPFMVWLQAAMWRKTEPSPIGAALRIAYALDYGVPHDFVEIAMGQAYTDYDSNGFLWEKLGTLPPEPDDDEQGDTRPLRQWPACISAVELERRRSAVKADYMVPVDEAPFSAGFGADNIAALKQRIGPFPDVYSDFLLLSGRRDDGYGSYADRLTAIDQMARDRIFSQERPQDDPVPRDAIFIGLEDGRHPEFILGGSRRDSPVFRFDADSGVVSQTGISVFSWVQTFMQHADAARSRASATLQAPAGTGTEVGGSILSMLRRLFRRD